MFPEDIRQIQYKNPQLANSHFAKFIFFSLSETYRGPGLSVYQACARLFPQTDYLPRLPRHLSLLFFPSPHPFKQPLGELVRFKAWTPSSLPEETLHLLQLHRVEGGGGIYPNADPSCTAPKVTHYSPSRTVFTGQSSCKGPLLAPGLLFRRLVVTAPATCCHQCWVSWFG